MKFGFDRNKLYLLMVYLAVVLLVLMVFSELLLSSLVWQLVIFSVLTLVFILTYDTFYKTIQQATGDLSSSELDVFSAVLELNKKIQNSMDVDKVLKLVEVTLKDQFNAEQVIIYLNESLGSSSLEFNDSLVNHHGLLIWPYHDKHVYNLKSELLNEVIQSGRIFSRLEELPFAEELFRETDTDLAIPVTHSGKLLCLILLKYREKDSFYLYKEEQLRVLTYLSGQLAIILDRLRIYQQVLQQTEMDHAEKMQVMQSISSNIAHEMRTPLSGIRASISGVEEYLPELIRAYNQSAKSFPEEFDGIRDDHLKSLNTTLNRITLMIDQANTVIDMLLMNLRETSLDDSQMNVCSASECINQAIERYPFKSGERSIIELDLDDDFKFLGIESLFIYVIFNLIKNALHSIRSAQNGKIYISLETAKQMDPLRPFEKFNVIYFRDTGKGIPEDIKDKVFDSFFTTKEGGTGAGLAYCKRTIQSFKGKITCESVVDEYCEFIITLPELDVFS
tara:strand:- start:50405 stop:51922 length:1518 start_codon:yes stop_codon:yes gene_type:complete